MVQQGLGHGLARPSAPSLLACLCGLQVVPSAHINYAGTSRAETLVLFARTDTVVQSQSPPHPTPPHLRPEIPTGLS